MTYLSKVSSNINSQEKLPSSRKLPNLGAMSMSIQKRLLAGSLFSLLLFSTAAPPLLARDISSKNIDSQSNKIEYTQHLKTEILEESNISELEATLISEEIEQFLVAETTQWTQAEKAALKEILILNLETSYLQELATMSESDLQKQVNSNPALKKINDTLPSVSESSKVLGAALFASYLTNIAKSFAIGMLNGTIQSGTPNLHTLFSALGRGDVRAFTSHLRQSFQAAPSFVSAMSRGASFACESASFGLGSGRSCARFASFTRRLFNRILELRRSNVPVKTISLEIRIRP